MKKSFILPIGDFIFSGITLYLAFFVRFGSMPDSESIFTLTAKFVTFQLILMLSAFFLEIYNQDKDFGKKEIVLRINIGLLVSFLILSTFYYLVPLVMLGRGLILVSLFSFGLLQCLWHICYRSLRSYGISRRIVILGTGLLAEKIGTLIKMRNNHYILSGYIGVASEPALVSSDSILLNERGLIDIVRKNNAQKIVVSMSERRGRFPFNEVLKCKLSGVEVVDANAFYEEVAGKLLIEDIRPSCLIFSDGFRMTQRRRLYKRLLDLFFASVGLLLMLPLFPIVAFLIRIDSSGPVFFKQLRVGEGESRFSLYKFRTMVNDAEKGNRAIWAQENDPRVTRIGKILRLTRLDETPQLYNVLKGDMSIVGPRPERPAFIEELKKSIPYYSERHYVKPGITGWAQIRYPYGASVEDALEKLRYDLYYIKHISIFFDIMIIMETIKVILFARGAR